MSDTCVDCPANEVSDYGGDCSCQPPDLFLSPLGKCLPWTVKTCDYQNEYRDMVTGDCVKASTYCPQGCSTSSPVCSFGIVSLHTKTSNTVCYTQATQCTASQYQLQALGVDRDGIVVHDLKCRDISPPCNSRTQYELRPPSKNENRVCVFKTVCNQKTHYTHQNATSTSDAICLPRKVCDYGRQVVMSTGNFSHDRECANILDCRALGTGTYLKDPPRNATANLEGFVGRCAAYSTCTPGEHISALGTPLSDVECKPCPAGFRGPDGLQCISCLPGEEYSLYEKQAECQACTVCVGDPEELNIPDELRCPSGETCTVAYASRCTTTRNSVCVECASTWKLDPGTGVCTPCKAGHHWTGSSCVRCPENMFCEDKTSFAPCPQMIAVPGTGGVPEFVPSSPQASFSDQQCSCSLRGGFEGSGSSLGGCVACADGHFRPPAALDQASGGCAPCPVGTWAARTRATDLYADGTVTLVGPDGANIPSPRNTVSVLVGASECTQCPVGMTTRKTGASSVDDCTKCGEGEFHHQGLGGCQNCSRECDSPDEYEVSPCSDLADRVCAPCNRDCGARVGFYTSECAPGSGSGDGCAMCNNLPAENARYVLPKATVMVTSPDACPWECDSGYFVGFDLKTCHRCTQFNSTQCPAGKVFSPCTWEKDASCGMACNNQTMPTTFARYIYRGDSPEGPNTGCEWGCQDGYYHSVTGGGQNVCRLARVGGLAFAVPP